MATLSPSRRAWLFYSLLVAVTALLLLASWLYMERARHRLEALPSDLAGQIDGEMLRFPLGDKARAGMYAHLEKEEADFRIANPEVLDVVISRLDGEAQHVIYPFYHAYLYPQFLFDVARGPHRTAPVQYQGGTVGYCYVEIDTGDLRILRDTVLAIDAIFLLIVMLLASNYKGQARRLQTATVELERRRREMIDLERLAMVGTLMANVFHDLRKPVLNIREEAEALEPGPLRDHLLEEVEMFLGMLRDLNLESFLRSDDSESEYLDLQDTLDRSLRLVRYERRDVEVSLDIPENIPLVVGRQHRLVQVFSNLLLNAFQVLDGRGNVWIRAAAEGRRSGSWIRVEVEDDGKGIPAVDRERVFQPFFTHSSRRDSIGLGLYICRTIMDELGGSIRVAKGHRGGACFVLLFPAAEDDLPAGLR